MGLLTLVAIVALPQAMSPAVRALVAATAVVQALAAWVWVPFPQQTADDRAAHAIATAMASAPARSILVDDRYAAGVLKWAPSMAPYLTTRDAGYEIALADPRRVVEYALVTPDDDGLTLDADVRDLPGMVEDWSWNGYTLYRRTDAPRINVRYDALMEASANGSRR